MTLTDTAYPSDEGMAVLTVALCSLRELEILELMRTGLTDLSAEKLVALLAPAAAPGHTRLRTLNMAKNWYAFCVVIQCIIRIDCNAAYNTFWLGTLNMANNWCVFCVGRSIVVCSIVVCST